jgi:hypothetical protein
MMATREIALLTDVRNEASDTMFRAKRQEETAEIKIRDLERALSYEVPTTLEQPLVIAVLLMGDFAGNEDLRPDGEPRQRIERTLDNLVAGLSSVAGTLVGDLPQWLREDIECAQRRSLPQRDVIVNPANNVASLWVILDVPARYRLADALSPTRLTMLKGTPLALLRGTPFVAARDRSRAIPIAKGRTGHPVPSHRMPFRQTRFRRQAARELLKDS